MITDQSQLALRAELLSASFDEYREDVAEMIVFDDDGSLQGLVPRAYFLKGIQEEVREIFIPSPSDTIDRYELLADPNSGVFPGDWATAEKQQKEFGDSLWYMANYLNTFGSQVTSQSVLIPAARHLEQGRARVLDRDDLDPSDTYRLRVAELVVTIHYINQHAEKQWRTTALDIPTESVVNVRDRYILRNPDERSFDEQELRKLIGIFMLQSDGILMARYGMSIENICMQNLMKLSDRIDRGVVFKTSAQAEDDGDTR